MDALVISVAGALPAVLVACLKMFSRCRRVAVDSDAQACVSR
jgi:hypothetical protein